ncbi:hypothetical protein SNOG_13109 [Parastagonospora nodorum SN15]|uniref:Uncharacterized protein n=1 Tax=Phaeosphaeria nodorum (strain SN15 / ATCC MYA-4574 / FGSC 10173) TaxID=321614 RepID=Q0U555_PHANO|nr:hypothetical protein SNOG_13109 [Parastagonospora nodorum SN15]EAT79436.1 hypothetical protein SNOG_13109 [Parastagonospora nodorum SN15]
MSQPVAAQSQRQAATVVSVEGSHWAELALGRRATRAPTLSEMELVAAEPVCMRAVAAIRGRADSFILHSGGSRGPDMLSARSQTRQPEESARRASGVLSVATQPSKSGSGRGSGSSRPCGRLVRQQVGPGASRLPSMFAETPLSQPDAKYSLPLYNPAPLPPRSTAGYFTATLANTAPLTTTAPTTSSVSMYPTPL